MMMNRLICNNNDMEKQLDELFIYTVKDDNNDSATTMKERQTYSSTPSNLERFLKMKYDNSSSGQRICYQSSEQSSPTSSVLSLFHKSNDVVMNDANDRQQDSSHNGSSYFDVIKELPSPAHNDDCGDNNNKSMKVKMFRKDITRLLENRIRLQCCKQNDGYNNKNVEIEKKIPILARQLENLLFKSASSIQTYKDVSTLDTRMRMLFVIQMQRRLKKKSSTIDRCRILRETLGDKRYEKIQNLLQEIKLEKTQLAATFCSKCIADSSGGGYCTKVRLTSRIRQDDKLPPAVRNLFFDDGLLDAFERYPVTSIQSIDWDFLQSRAEEGLRVFREWKMETT